tara:strand:- start:1046 stop:1606 length:561 start_codon:yes stop_codon:yes gene_type:complete
MIVDLFLVFQFIKRLSTPFAEWKAYKLGIIDESGKQLIKRSKFTTREQKDSFGIFDIMIMKLKRLLEKVPGGKSRIGSYAAALYLIKEHDEIISQGEMLTEEQLETKLSDYMEQVSGTHQDMDALFEAMWDEDAPANSAGSGNIAGIGVGADGEPGVSPRTQKKKKKNANSVLKRFKDTIPTTPKG